MPVGGVVTRMVTWEAEVGYFILFIACSLQGGREHFEKPDAQLLIRFMKAVRLPEAIEWGALFDGEVVGRDVFHAEVDGLLQICRPSFFTLAG